MRHSPNTRVRIFAGLAAGKTGTVTQFKGDDHCVLVDDESMPWTTWCPASDIAPIRERATEAAAPTPEQERLDALAAEVKELRAIFDDWQQRVVAQLEQMAPQTAAQTFDELTKTELDPVDGETLPQLAARVVTELRAQMQWGSELFRACEAVVGRPAAGPGGEDEVVTRLRAIPVALQELLDYATERQAAQAAVPPSARSPEGATAAELIGRIRNRVEGISALLDGAAEDERMTRERLANIAALAQPVQDEPS